MRPLLFLASVAALGLLPSRSIPPESGHALRGRGAGEDLDGSAGVALTQAAPAAAIGGTPTPVPAPAPRNSAGPGRQAPPATPVSPTVHKLKAMPPSTQWFHPAGHGCPAWEYDAGTSAAAESARVACQRYSLRWLNGAPCVPKRGPSIPSC